MSVLAFESAFCKFTFCEDLKINTNFHNTLSFNEICCALSRAFETFGFRNKQARCLFYFSLPTVFVIKLRRVTAKEGKEHKK